MTAHTAQGRPVSYPTDRPEPSKAQQQVENKRLMAEYEAKNGKVETTPIVEHTVESLKATWCKGLKNGLSKGNSPGRPKKDQK